MPGSETASSRAGEDGLGEDSMGENGEMTAASPPPTSTSGTEDSASASSSRRTGSVSGSAGPGGAMTSGESVEALDGQFDESLAVFDGMILTERAAAQAMGDANPAANQGGGAAGMGTGDEEGEEGGAGGFGGPLFEEADLGDESGPGGMGGQQGEDGNGQSGTMTGSTGQGGSVAGGTIADGRATQGAIPGMPGRGKGDGTVPPDLVDGSDDDIVARQIREAAMAEKDPALREKLWDEYRKYKKGS